MTPLREAAQQALEALEDFRFAAGFDRPLAQDAIDALREALAQQDEPVEPVAWYRPSIAPDYYAPVFVAGAQPPAPLTQAEARLLGWRPLVPPKAEPVQEPVATVTECEACFTPDVRQLRGTCDYYTASQMRIAAPPRCPSCASLEAQNTELDRKLAELEQAYQSEYNAGVAAERETIIQAMPGGHSVDPQWVCDMIRARGNP